MAYWILSAIALFIFFFPIYLMKSVSFHLEAPTAIIGFEDTTLSFSPIIIDYLDQNNDIVLVLSLSAQYGVLKLGRVQSAPALKPFHQSSQDLYYRGTFTALREALFGLTYTGSLNWSGVDCVNIALNQYNFENPDDTNGFIITSSQISVEILPVNDIPYFIIDRAFYETNEDEPVRVTGVSIEDHDAIDGELFRLTIRANDGNACIGNLFTNKKSLHANCSYGNSSFVLIETLPMINAALSRLIFLPFEDINSVTKYESGIEINMFDFNIKTPELENVQCSMFVPILITPVNDCPKIHFVSNEKYLLAKHDSIMALSALRIEDVEWTENPNAIFFTIIYVQNGTLHLPDQKRAGIYVNQSEPQSLTFEGSILSVNAAISEIHYSNNFTDIDTLNVTVYDLGTYSNDWSIKAVFSVPIYITYIYKPPYVFSPIEWVSIYPGQSILISEYVKILYENKFQNQKLFVATLSCMHGFFSIDNTDIHNIEFGDKKIISTSTIDYLQALLKHIHYKQNSISSEMDTLELKIANFSSNKRITEDIYDSSTTVFIFVELEKKSPTISAPIKKSVLEGSELNLSYISIDYDFGDDQSMLMFKISCTHGFFQFNEGRNLYGAHFSYGKENPKHELVLSGTREALNSILKTDLIYICLTEGIDEIHMKIESTNGMTNTGSIAIHVLPEMQPTLQICMEDTIILEEDTEIEIPVNIIRKGFNSTIGLSILLDVDLSVSIGTLHIPFVDDIMPCNIENKNAFRGLAKDINFALKRLKFVPPINWNSHSNGVAILNISCAHSAVNYIGPKFLFLKTTIIIVESIFDIPVLHFPDFIQSSGNKEVLLPQIIIDDVDEDENLSEISELTLKANQISDGRFLFPKYPGFHVLEISEQNNYYKFGGNVQTLNEALRNIIFFTPKSGCIGTLHISLYQPFKKQRISPYNNSLASFSVNGTIDIFVEKMNTPLTISVPTDMHVLEDSSNVIQNIYISGTESVIFGVNLTAMYGVLSLDVPYEANTDCSESILWKICLSGDIVQIQTLIAQLVYTGYSNWNVGKGVLDWINITMTDKPWFLGEVVHASFSIQVDAVNDAPMISINRANVTVNYNEPFYFSDLIVIDDIDLVDFPNSVIELSISVQHGNITFTSTSGTQIISESIDGSYILLAGTLENANAALKNVVYTSSNIYVKHDELEIIVNDLGSRGVGSPLETRAIINIQVTKQTKNPTAKCLSKPVMFYEDDSIYFENLLTVIGSDSDVVMIHITSNNGRVELFSIDTITVPYIILNRGFANLELKGEIFDINEAISKIKYIPAGNFTGSDEIVLQTFTDQMALNASQCSLYVHVLPVNDPPEIHFDNKDLYSVHDKSPIHISGIRISDPDMHTDVYGNSCQMAIEKNDGTIMSDIDYNRGFSVTIYADHGNISVTSSIGIFMNSNREGNFGNSDEVVASNMHVNLSGSLEVINRILRTLLYTPDSCFVGIDTVHILVGDGGNCGEGDEKHAESTFTVHVNKLLDSPSITINGTAATEVELATEEHQYLNLPLIKIDDCSTVIIEVNISAINGELIFRDGAPVHDVHISSENCNKNDMSCSFTDLRIIGTANTVSAFINLGEFFPFKIGLWSFKVDAHTPVFPPGHKNLAMVTLSASRTESSLKSTLNIKISVVSVNNPPIIESLHDTIVLSPRVPLEIPYLSVYDPEFQNFHTTEEWLDLFISVNSSFVELHVDTFLGLQNAIRDLDSSKNAIHLSGGLEQLNLILSKLKIALLSNSVEEMLCLNVTVKDNGYGGIGGEKFCTKFIPILQSKIPPENADYFLSFNSLSKRQMVTFEDTPASIQNVSDVIGLMQGEVSVRISTKIGSILLQNSTVSDAQVFAAEKLSLESKVVLNEGTEQFFSHTQAGLQSKKFELNSTQKSANFPDEFLYQDMFIIGCHTTIQSILSIMTYIPSTDWNSHTGGYDTILIFGPAGQLELTIEVIPVNDSPTFLLAPELASSKLFTVEGQSLLLSGISVNDIESEFANDYDFLEPSLKLVLEAKLGAIRLADTHGLIFNAKIPSNFYPEVPPLMQLTVRGSLRSLNRALKQLYYYPPDSPFAAKVVEHVLKLEIVGFDSQRFFVSVSEYAGNIDGILEVILACDAIFSAMSEKAGISFHVSDLLGYNVSNLVNIAFRAYESDVSLQILIRDALYQCENFAVEYISFVTGESVNKYSFEAPFIVTVQSNIAEDQRSIVREIQLVNVPEPIAMVVSSLDLMTEDSLAEVKFEALPSCKIGNAAFTIQFMREKTEILYGNSTSQDVKAALKRLSNIGDIEVIECEILVSRRCWMLKFLTTGFPVHIGSQDTINISFSNVADVCFKGFVSQITTNSASSDIIIFTIDDLDGKKCSMSMDIYVLPTPKPPKISTLHIEEPLILNPGVTILLPSIKISSYDSDLESNIEVQLSWMRGNVHLPVEMYCNNFIYEEHSFEGNLRRKISVKGDINFVNDALKNMKLSTPVDYIGWMDISIKSWHIQTDENELNKLISYANMHVLVQGDVPLPGLSMPQNITVFHKTPTLIYGIHLNGLEHQPDDSQLLLTIRVQRGSLSLDLIPLHNQTNIISGNDNRGLMTIPCSVFSAKFILNSLVYTGMDEFFGADILTIDLRILNSDNNLNSTLLMSSTSINVVAGNFPPMIHIPEVLRTTWVVKEDTSILFGSGIMISDGNLMKNSYLLVEIFIAKGAFLSSGSKREMHIVIEGEIEDVNKVLSQGFLYQGCLNCWGIDDIVVEVISHPKDVSLSRRSSVTIPIFVEPVNDPPKIELPAVLPSEVIENTITPIPLNVKDVDVEDSDGLLTVTITCFGELNFISIQNFNQIYSSLPLHFLSGSTHGFHDALRFSAPLEFVTQALSLLAYKSETVGNGGFEITVTDNGNTGIDGKEQTAKKIINILSIPEPQKIPVWVLPTKGYVETDVKGFALIKDVSIKGIEDGNSNANDFVVTISANLGTVSNISTIINFNANTLEDLYSSIEIGLSGTASDICTLLSDGFSYHMNAKTSQKTDDIYLHIRDAFYSWEASANLPVILRNRPAFLPELLATETQIGAQVGTPFRFTIVSILQPSIIDDKLYTLRASVLGKGTLKVTTQVPGLWIEIGLEEGSDCKCGQNILVHGTISTLNEDFLKEGMIVYVPSIPDKFDTVTFSLSSFKKDRIIENIEVVSEISIIADVSGEITYPEIQTSKHVWYMMEGNTLSISGIELVSGSGICHFAETFKSIILKLEISCIGGTVIFPNLNNMHIVHTGTGTNMVTMLASVFYLNIALSSFLFYGDKYYNGRGSVVLSFHENNIATANKDFCSNESTEIIIVIKPVNNPPKIHLPLSSQRILDEDAHHFPIQNLYVSDPDAHEQIESFISLVVSVNNGSLYIDSKSNYQPSAINSNSNLIELRGTLEMVNFELEGLIYVPELNFNGYVNVTCSVNDEGNSGFGGSLTSTDNFDLYVRPVNDPPVVNMPQNIEIPNCKLNCNKTVVPLLGVVQIDDVDTTDSEIFIAEFRMSGLYGAPAHGSISFPINNNLSIDRTIDFDSSTFIKVTGTLNFLQSSVTHGVYTLNSFYYWITDKIDVTIHDGSGAFSSAWSIISVPPNTPMPSVISSFFNITSMSNSLEVLEDSPLDFGQDLQLGIEFEISQSHFSSAFSTASLEKYEISVKVSAVKGFVYFKNFPTGISPIDDTENFINFINPRTKNTIIFQGNLASTSEALKELVYIGAKNQSGPDEISILVECRGKSSTIKFEIQISPVNDPPIMFPPLSTDLHSFDKDDENQKLIISGIRIEDSDLDFGAIEVSLEFIDCKVYLPNSNQISTNLNITETNLGKISVSGDLVSVNTALEIIHVVGKLKGFDRGILILAVDPEGALSNLHVPFSSVDFPEFSPKFEFLPEFSLNLTINEDEKDVKIGTGVTLNASFKEIYFPQMKYDVTVSCMYAANLEVQKLTVLPFALHTIQSIEISAISGSFIITLDSSGLCKTCSIEVSNPLPYNATANQLEIMLRRFNLIILGVQDLTVSRFDLSLGFRWIVTFIGIINFPPLHVEPDSYDILLGNFETEVKIFSEVINEESGMGGKYSISFDNAVQSKLIAHTASGKDIEKALLELPNVRAVSVQKHNEIDKNVYMITFIDAGNGGDLPLLKAKYTLLNSNILSGYGVNFYAEEIEKGVSKPDIWCISTYTSYRDLEFTLSMTDEDSASNLVLLKFSFDNSDISYKSDFIYPHTAGESSDDSTSIHKSLQSMLNNVLKSMKQNGSLNSDLKTAVFVNRSENGHMVSWQVVFNDIPPSFPLPILVSTPWSNASLSFINVPTVPNGGFSLGLRINGASIRWSKSIAVNASLDEFKSAVALLQINESPLRVKFEVFHYLDATQNYSIKWTIAVLSGGGRDLQLYVRPDSEFKSFKNMGISIEKVKGNSDRGTIQLEPVPGITLLPGLYPEWVSFCGTYSSIAESLQLLKFTPPKSYHGDVAVIFHIKNGLNDVNFAQVEGSRELVRWLSVVSHNDSPELRWCGKALGPYNTPLILRGEEDTPYRLSSFCGFSSSIEVFDIDEGVHGLTVHISADIGSLKIDNKTIYVLNGSAEEINNYFKGLTYVPQAQWNGIVQLSFDVYDEYQANANAEIYIDILAINDAPTLSWTTEFKTVQVLDTVDNSIIQGLLVNANEDHPLYIFENLTISDADCNSDVTNDSCYFSVMVSCTYCYIKCDRCNIPRMPRTGDNENVNIFGWKGDISTLNVVLNSVIYICPEHWNGVDIVTVLIDDRGDGKFNNPFTTELQLVVDVHAIHDILNIDVPMHTINAYEDEVLVIGSSRYYQKATNFTVIERSIFISDLDILSETVKSRYSINGNYIDSALDSSILVDINVNYGTVLLPFVPRKKSSMHFYEGNTGLPYKTISFSGPIEVANEILSEIHYHGGLNMNSDIKGLDHIQLTVKKFSGISNTGTISIKVQAQNDPPVIDVEHYSEYDHILRTHDQLSSIIIKVHSINTTEDTLTQLPKITVRDADLVLNSSNKNYLSKAYIDVSIFALRGYVRISSRNNPQYGMPDSKSLFFRASIADVNSALSELTYIGGENLYGTDSIVITASDLGNSGSSYLCNNMAPALERKFCSLNCTVVIPIFIQSIPDSPKISYLETISVNEDTSMLIPGLSFVEFDNIDPNINGGVDVFIETFHGHIVLSASIDGLTFYNDTIYGKNFKRIHFSSLPRDANRVLENFIYRPDTDFNGLDRISLNISNSHSALGGFEPIPAFSEVTMLLRIIPFNDFPTIFLLLDTVSIKEDDTLLLSMVQINDKDFQGIDGFYNERKMSVLLQCSNCKFEFVDMDSIFKIELSNENNSRVPYVGPQTNGLRNILFTVNYDFLQSTMNSIIYRPDQDWYGSDQVLITVHDLGCCGFGGDLSHSSRLNVNIYPVNDPPNCVQPLFPMTIAENSAKKVDSFYVSDSDLESILQVEVAVNIGVLYYGLANFPENEIIDIYSPSVLQLNGTVSEVNIALRELHYILPVNWESNQNLSSSALTFEPHRIEIKVTDEHGVKDTCWQTVIVIPMITDDPIIDAPGAHFVLPPCHSSGLYPIELRCKHVISVDVIEAVEDQPLNLVGISIYDSDGKVRNSTILDVQLISLHGSFLVEDGFGIQFSFEHDAHNSRLVGSRSHINNVLQTLVYTPDLNFNGNDSILIRVSTSLGGYKEITIPLRIYPVADTPVILVSNFEEISGFEDEIIWMPNFLLLDADDNANQRLNKILLNIEDLEYNPIFNITISANFGSIMLFSSLNLSFVLPEFDGSNVPANVYVNKGAISNPVKGYGRAPLSILWWKFVEYSGLLSNVRTSLTFMAYRPEANFNGIDVLTVSVTDEHGLSSSILVPITVKKVNDPPVLTGVGANYHPYLPSPDLLSLKIISMNLQYIKEDTDLFLNILHLQLRDVDNSEYIGTYITLTISSFNGNVKLNPLPRSEVILLGSEMSLYEYELKIKGTLRGIQDALEKLVFSPKLDYHGDKAGVKFVVTDEGEDIGINKNTCVLYIPITVLPVNDLPSLIVPTVTSNGVHESVDENGSIRLGGVNPSLLQNSTQTYQSQLTNQDFELVSLDIAKCNDKYPKIDQLGSTMPSWLTVLNDSIIYSATNIEFGRELWKTDGESKPMLLMDLFPGQRDGNPEYFTVFQSKVYFSTEGIDLKSWTLLYPDECEGFKQASFNPQIHFFVAESSIWYPNYAYNCPVGYHWASTAEGKKLFPTPYYDLNLQINKSKKHVYFNECGWKGYVYNGVHREKFRFSDSLETGAFKHAGRNEDSKIEFDFDSSKFAGIICVVNIDEKYGYNGKTLWRTDGTSKGTIQLESHKNIQSPSYMTPFMNRLFFAAYNPSHGVELYSSDGSVTGSVLELDIYPGAHSSHPKELVSDGRSISERLFLSANDGKTGQELWVFSIYQQNAQAQVIDIYPGLPSSNPLWLVYHPLLDRLLFSADDGIHGRELWSSDGTPQGTSIVSDIYIGTKGSCPSELTVFKNLLIFSANDGKYGRELWSYDGAVTVKVKDIRSGFMSSNPSHLIVPPNDSLLYFIASDGTSKMSAFGSHIGVSSEFFYTDGTAVGTKRVTQQKSPYTYSDFIIGKNDADIQGRDKKDTIVAVNGRIVFSAINLSKYKPNPNFSLIQNTDMFLLVHDTEDDWLELTLSCSKCTITVGRTEINEELIGSSVKLYGFALLINDAMRNVTYRGLAGESGFDTVNISVCDLYQCGINPANETISVFVQAVNDPPIVTVPENVIVTQVDKEFGILGISIFDRDAIETAYTTPKGVYIEAPISVFINVTHGHISLVYIENISFLSGSGYSDDEIVLVGSVLDINRSIGTLLYRCNNACIKGLKNENGQIIVTADDNGYTGKGGPKWHSATIIIALSEELLGY